ncbi:hydrogenase maturation protein HypF [Elusimicrobium posterum]|uniref:carbamoyltransferase HypF n=1 Tax=Elusimicrobium posterum TaxID=3116653 RepID=UPI003C723AFC
MLRKKLLITGIVQGVGFRPFLYKTTAALRLSGSARNTSRGVICEVQGSEEQINKFIKVLNTKAPPQAKIESIKISDAKVKKETGFKILESKTEDIKTAQLPPDLALCKNCAAEITDKKNRRYLYPLTNCTDCGPRFSITKTLPYDRSKTTMAKFKMCPQCKAEYEDVVSRRFHAQPNACPVCGPKVFFINKNKKIEGKDALKLLAESLKEGKIAAIKSIGGYHLACDAKNKKVVELLRKRKNRPHKPFALMFADLESMRKYCTLTKLEQETLLSPAAPVVIVKKKKELPAVAPKLDTYGVMLPYTPLHKIIFSLLPKDSVLVMTSANKSGGALCNTDKEALTKMKNIADVFLTHERKIYNKLDDSIMQEVLGEMLWLRRARGATPEPLKFKKSYKKNILALGANKTAAFCLLKDDKAYLSQYIGDLDNRENQKFYLDALEKNKKLTAVSPSAFVKDLHPGYFTSGLDFKPAKEVQHHTAHALSVAAEHGLENEFLGIIFDGSGLGTDGTIWGGEFLHFKNKSFKRRARFEHIPLIGGDNSVKEIWKLGLAILFKTYGDAWVKYKHLLKGVTESEITTALKMLKTGINCPPASSAGRLFDAVAFFAGLMSRTSYQAQAACELQALYKPNSKTYQIQLAEENGLYILKYAAMIGEILKEKTAADISTKFHNAVINAAAETAKKINVKTIVLSGGCFQNKILLDGAYKKLTKAGFKVYYNIQVPANDGGVALGQAYALAENYI